MNRIDFLGPAGVGKTLTYNLIRDSKSHSYILAEKDAMINCRKRILKRSSNLSLKHRILGQIPQLLILATDSELKKEEAKLFSIYANNYSKFLKVTSKMFCESKRSDFRRAEGYYNFIKILRRLAFYNKWTENGTILFDESLTQKVYAVLPGSDNNREFAIDYFKNLPLPSGLIFIESEPQNILDRIKKRKKEKGYLIPAHRGLSDQEILREIKKDIEIANLGKTILENRGVDICHIYAKNINEVKEYIDNKMTFKNA